ncbi:MAG: 3-phosphoglycerate dehydrogenase family protein [Desulfobulbaceae bacterium]|nr:3-phosphoglycerate dehydrogenase family protein [Desulfobulbaceae bacterium]
MQEFTIKTLNNIAREGLALLDRRYLIDPDAPDPDGILVRSSPVDTGDYPSLLAVARAGAGVNNITVDKATASGICVFNTPGANANAVAELVFIMLGMAARNIYHGLTFCQGLAGGDDDAISRRVEEQKKSFRGFELAGKTLGILGLGQIGVRVANRGVVQGMRVIGFDPFPALENIHALSPEVTLARSMAEVLRHADILSLHLPLNNKTRGLVGAELLGQLPRGAMLVNYARGPIVDSGAVLAALAAGGLSRYITDFPAAALLNHPGVIVSPHLGASTEESEEHCAVMAVRELRGYLESGTITHSVNFPTVESIPSDGVHTRFIMINRDVPGMIGFASQIIGAHHINISSYLNESNGTVGYNIIDLEDAIPPEVVSRIEAHAHVIRTRTIRLR